VKYVAAQKDPECKALYKAKKKELIRKAKEEGTPLPPKQPSPYIAHVKLWRSQQTEPVPWAGATKKARPSYYQSHPEHLWCAAELHKKPRKAPVESSSAPVEAKKALVDTPVQTNQRPVKRVPDTEVVLPFPYTDYGSVPQPEWKFDWRTTGCDKLPPFPPQGSEYSLCFDYLASHGFDPATASAFRTPNPEDRLRKAALCVLTVLTHFQQVWGESRFRPGTPRVKINRYLPSRLNYRYVVKQRFHLPDPPER
jgi:hypothetical protein